MLSRSGAWLHPKRQSRTPYVKTGAVLLGAQRSHPKRPNAPTVYASLDSVTISNTGTSAMNVQWHPDAIRFSQAIGHDDNARLIPGALSPVTSEAAGSRAQCAEPVSDGASIRLVSMPKRRPYLNSSRSSKGILICDSRIGFIGFCHPVGWWTPSWMAQRGIETPDPCITKFRLSVPLWRIREEPSSGSSICE